MGLEGGVPTEVGNYAVSGKLGEGTFGVVLKGMHKLAQEKVAIKVLEKRRMQQADDIERVGREIQILKQLRHPHVVRLWEIIYASSRIYLVMEFCARGELFPTRDCIDPQLVPRWPLDDPGTRALEFRTSVFVD